MPIISSKFAITCASGLFLCLAAWAKRKAPEPVPPVVVDTIRYSVEGDGRAQSIVAASLSTGAVLWRVEIFRTKIRPRLEEDVQWVFINRLSVAGNVLLIHDEKGRCFSLELTTKVVKQQPCAAHLRAEIPCCVRAPYVLSTYVSGRSHSPPFLHLSLYGTMEWTAHA